MIGFIDAAESWLVAQPLWIQVPILMVTLVPICWLVAGLVDRVVGFILRKHRSGRLGGTDEAGEPTEYGESAEPGERSELNNAAEPAEPSEPAEPDSLAPADPVGPPTDGHPGPAEVHHGAAPRQISRQTLTQPRRTRPRRPLPALSRLWMSIGLALLVAVAAGFSIWRSAR